MDSFILGETIENYKLPIPRMGVVQDEVVLVRHLGNLLVHRVKVQVRDGDDTLDLEWLCQNVRRPLVPSIITEQKSEPVVPVLSIA